jgi:hypothetical protein
MGPRASLDTEVRRKILSPLPGIEPRSPGRPVRSQTPQSNSPAKCELIEKFQKLILNRNRSKDVIRITELEEETAVNDDVIGASVTH